MQTVCVQAISYGRLRLKQRKKFSRITYGSERIDEPVESVTVKRGDFNVKIDACADKASRRTGNKENMAKRRG